MFPVQEIASLKRQFAELLSDIGFIKEGLRARVIERLSAKGTDGVLEATGPEVSRTDSPNPSFSDKREEHLLKLVMCCFPGKP